jgi:hypothetical protein
MISPIQTPMTMVLKNESNKMVTIRVDHVEFEMWKGTPRTLAPGDILSIPTAFARDSIVILMSSDEVRIF